MRFHNDNSARLPHVRLTHWTGCDRLDITNFLPSARARCGCNDLQNTYVVLVLFVLSFLHLTHAAHISIAHRHANSARCVVVVAATAQTLHRTLSGHVRRFDMRVRKRARTPRGRIVWAGWRHLNTINTLPSSLSNASTLPPPPPPPSPNVSRNVASNA